MSAWRVERHYGFGAARIPIQPEPHRALKIGLAEGAGILIGELTRGGLVATMQRTAGEARAILLSLLILAFVVVTLTRDHSDLSSIEVVLLKTVAPPPQSHPEEIEEVEELAPIEIARSNPPERVARKPLPAPRIAERPKPPPPVLNPKPQAHPKPVISQIARIEAPRPPPVQKLARVMHERPQPIARPRVAIETVMGNSSPPIPRTERIARRPVVRPNPAHLAPRPDAPAALALPGQAAPEDSRSTRTFGPRATASRAARGPAPKLSSASVPRPSRVPSAMPERVARLAPTTSLHSAPRPTVQVVGVSSLLEPTRPKPASWSRRAVPESPRGPAGHRAIVVGVPLGELASCISDREEDRLKQAVAAAVTTQAKCVSQKGTYRFIETRNLNAFLMWISRNPARSVENRCVELDYALECLQNARRRAAR